MLLHLGGDVVIPKKEIIAIIDIKNKSKSKSTEEFLQTADEEGFIKHVAAPGKEKSFIITNKYIYLSPISASTLKKRAENIKKMIEEWAQI